MSQVKLKFIAAILRGYGLSDSQIRFIITQL